MSCSSSDPVMLYYYDDKRERDGDGDGNVAKYSLFINSARFLIGLLFFFQTRTQTRSAPFILRPSTI